MEKLSLGKKIRKTAGIIGISAISMMPSDKLPVNLEKNIDLEKNKIEWTSEELSSPESTEKVATFLAEEEEKDRYSNMVSFLNGVIDEYSGELIHREITGNPTKYFLRVETNKMVDDLKEFKVAIEDYKEKLDSVNKNPLVPAEIIKEKVKEIKKIISTYDAGRQWVLDNINNPEYLERLKIEAKESRMIDGENNEDDGEIALATKDERAFSIAYDNYILSKDIKGSYLKANGDSTMNVGAFYTRQGSKTYFPIEEDSVRAVEYAIHEYAHAVTLANDFINSSVIKLFSKAFDSLSVAVNLKDRANKNIIKNILYFSDPTEMYARKKTLDHDLEVLGVKKYEEKFTEKHYIEALRLKKEGKLSSGSVDFLFSIKPKMIKKVMNEIAEVHPQSKREERQELA